MSLEERELMIKFLIRHGHKEENLRNNFNDEKLEELYGLVTDLFNNPNNDI